MDKDELLYHYFSNSLTELQQKEFEALLASDPEFKKQFEYESDLKRAIKAQKHQELKEKLNAFEAKINTKQPRTSYSYIRIAASIVLLITLGWLGYQSFFGINYDTLYQSNYDAYPNTVFSITRGDTINSLEREAFVAYEAKNYDLAITKFDQLEPSDHLSFYKGQSYLALDDTESAKALFLEVIGYNTSLTAEAKWYLALIYIKEKDKGNATKYLTELKTQHSYNKDKVEALLDAID